jgi:hypothetical protein
MAVDAVVGHPEHAQHHEADQPGTEVRHQLEQGFVQLDVADQVLGQAQFDHEQGHGDGEDAVDQRFDAVFAELERA